MPGFLFDTWIGIYVPKNTPKAVIDRLNAETATALNDSRIRDKLTELALEPRSSAPEELGRRTREGLAKVAKVIKEAGIKPD